MLKVFGKRAMEEPWSFTVDAKRSHKRARFNLLALEHDEYYFQVLCASKQNAERFHFVPNCKYHGDRSYRTETGEVNYMRQRGEKSLVLSDGCAERLPFLACLHLSPASVFNCTCEAWVMWF